MSTLPNDSIGSKREHFPVISCDSIIRLLSLQTMPLSRFFSSHLINWRKQKTEGKAHALVRRLQMSSKATEPVPLFLTLLPLILRCWVPGFLSPVFEKWIFTIINPGCMSLSEWMDSLDAEQRVQGLLCVYLWRKLAENVPSPLEPYRFIIQQHSGGNIMHFHLLHPKCM